MNEAFDLERFVIAQDPVFETVLLELCQGRKREHWIWFIFPQLRGLGHSWEADHFGIASREEADAYLKHSILGQRLVECTSLVNRIGGHSIQEIFGGIDSVKFRSSMTLFAEVEPHKKVFAEALEKYFGGVPDQLTLEMLRRSQQAAKA